MASPGNFERLKSKESKVSTLKKRGRQGIVYAWKQKEGPMQGSRRGDPISVYVLYDPNDRRYRPADENYVVAFGSNPGTRLGRSSWGAIPGDSYHTTKEDARKAAVKYIKSRS